MPSFCPSCGSQLRFKEAEKCPTCNHELTRKSNKNPLLAAILNFLLPGIGYLYIGTRKFFAILIIISMLSFAVWAFTLPENIFDQYLTYSISYWAFSIILAIAFAIDAYQEVVGR
ncbi:hypothetical protein D5R95_07730 [Methanosalsum natronophilum]|uniref:Uncharacterized protein n=1 Tax=Methanosalsum natronophilum TaxID=768733 RepID=A0A424YSF3_9EURY|nr:MAG: hypothetical protein D5R95_07730 [Methanosalsum natronophilum]